MQQEIGLGPAARIESLRITWPTALHLTETHKDIAVNHVYHIIEGEAPQRLDRPPVPFRKAADSAHSTHFHEK